jgi:hypothetical protein
MVLIGVATHNRKTDKFFYYHAMLNNLQRLSYLLPERSRQSGRYEARRTAVNIAKLPAD